MLYTLKDLLAKNATCPKQIFIWSGIKDVSFGFIFGAAKTGKTIFCENLLMSLAAGREEFWGLPLPGKPQKTLFISLEEYWQNRAERAHKQLQQFSEDEIALIQENFKTNDENFPTFFTKDEDWEQLEDLIIESKAKLVIIDSLTRLCDGPIEKSEKASSLAKNLREMAYRNGISILVIHHSIKISGQILDQNTMAGSRVLSAESDFIFGLSKTPKGERYFKEIAFRYYTEETEKVQVYKINDDLCAEPLDSAYEYELLKDDDKRFGSDLKDKIQDYIEQNTTVGTKEIVSHFKKLNHSERTIKYNLASLVQKGIVLKPKRGIYESKDTKKQKVCATSASSASNTVNNAKGGDQE